MIPTDWRDRYAKLLLRKALNVVPGKDIIIDAPVEAAPFAAKLTEEGYKAGARYVHTRFRYQKIRTARVRHAGEEFLNYWPEFEFAGLADLSTDGGSWLYLLGEDPLGLDGLDTGRKGRLDASYSRAYAPARHLISTNGCRWNVASYPTTPWAKRIYPELPVEEARTALVRDLVVACRLDRKDYLAAWDEHLHRLDGITALLEGKRYRALRLIGEGTNVTMELPSAHRWLTPRGRTPDGGSFLMNVPAEKIYTAPDFRRVDGTITSSRPLIFMGDDLGRVTLTWRNGKLAEFKASKDRILLEAWLTVDEGASRVGEVALVPSRSPVSRIDRPLRMNIFDESAGSHLAFGYAYPLCLEGGELLTPEQRMAAGLNVSVQHKNVVFGDPTLDVYGITPAGGEEPVMTDGNWAGAFADIADAPANAPAAGMPGYRKVS